MKDYTKERILNLLRVCLKLKEISQTEFELLSNAIEDKDEFMTVKEVCKILKVTEKTVGNYVNEGILKKYKIGSQTIRLLKSEILASIRKANRV